MPGSMLHDSPQRQRATARRTPGARPRMLGRIWVALTGALLSLPAMAAAPAGDPAASAAGPAADAAAAKPARQLGQYSGYEGREAELGRMVAAALREAKPAGGPADRLDPRYDFTGREEMLGLAMTQVVRTLNHNRSYQHEMNDALVKMTLDHIMFAKRHGMLEKLVDEDINSQRQQLERVKRLIDRGGSRDLALVAIFEQTACFFQLVDRTERAPGRVTYRSPFRTVLAETVRMGIHDLSEREIHERWTIPRMQAYAKVLGVELDVTPWREDGTVTVSVRGGA
ncbi:MAG: hypothetical protein MUF07_10415 [Steroidobacteraceae bacterium]|nr:hypothetical protein [Steroidobacteraceae bacterium]